MDINVVNGYQNIGQYGIKNNVAVNNNLQSKNTQIGYNYEIQVKRSNIAATLKPLINNISNIMQIKSHFQEQYNLLNNSTTTNYIDKYNSLQDNIEKKIKQLIESHDYFDGLYGAKRYKPEELMKNKNKIMQNIKENIINLDKKVQELQNEATKKINNEIIKSKEQTPIKQYNFGKESSDFSSNNLNNIAGNIVYAQGNINPANIQKEVLY